ncbi:MAG: SMC family ATPase [Cyanobacteria bacterium J06573_11]
MQILSVVLTNFKTHKEKEFHFQPGTNAICGENGAGKTSILEAIAWVLFNYQGNYKKEDLIRNGASSAQVRVAFISSRDSRTYEVQRSTTAQGYTIYDPQLAEKLPYTRTKDEVLPWLRQNLGVAAGTDLGQLFANTIGVPQGTFTADFLLSPEKRKPIFDTILKVEEYREAFKQSNALRKFAEAQVQRLKDLVEQYEEALQSWDELNNRQAQLQTEIKQGDENLERLEQQSQTLDKRRQGMAQQAQQLQTLDSELKTLSSQLEAQEKSKERLDSAIAQAQSAVDICKTHKVAYEMFLAAEEQIKDLNKQQQARQKILKQQQDCQQSLAKSQADLSRLEAKLEQFSNADKALSAIAADVETQTKLETERTGLQKQIQVFSNLRFQQKNLTRQSQTIAKEIQTVEEKLQQLSQLKTTCEQIPEWEQQQNRIQEQLSRLEAAQQFEQELNVLLDSGKARQDEYREQVVAALSTLDGWVAQFAELKKDAIAPIKEVLFQGGLISKALLTNITAILNDLTEQTNKQQLQKQHQTLQKNLKQAYAQQAELTQQPAQKTKQTQLLAQQQENKRDLAAVNRQLTNEIKTTESLEQIERQLKALDNPKGKQQLLQKNLQQKETVQKQHRTLEKSRAADQSKLETLSELLKRFEQLERQLQAQQQLKQTHQAGYLLHIQNQQSAQQLDRLKAEQDATAQELKIKQTQQATLTKQLTALSKAFDPDAFTLLEKQFSDVKSQADRLRGSLPQLRERHIDLTRQIDTLKATAEKRDKAAAEIKQRERIKRFINYARKVYKEAGPRITERYVYNISREADRLFRELLGRANVALTWSADYEITVQEGAHTRRFINLSGGEQMCAALAVRLALLKVLADIDVAFFDEPTTNMDRPRRAGLAEAIARIKSFRQLFVISHDDTFEQVTETVITVERDA